MSIKSILAALNLLGVILLLMLVLLLSWKPSPELKNLPVLPKVLLFWADAEVNGNIRTAVPMLCLGFFGGCWLAIYRKSFRYWVYAALLAFILLSVVELGQEWLPERHADLGDIGWGMAGTICGLIVAAFCYQLGSLLWNSFKRKG